MVMPIYTVAILVFFIYTIVKILFKNKDKDKEDEEDDEEFLNSDYYKNHLAQQKAAAAKKKDEVKNPQDEAKVKSDEPLRNPSPSKEEICDKNKVDQVKPVKTNVVRFKLDEKMEDETGNEDEKPDEKEEKAVEEEEVKIAPKESSSSQCGKTSSLVADPSKNKNIFTQIFVQI